MQVRPKRKLSACSLCILAVTVESQGNCRFPAYIPQTGLGAIYEFRFVRKPWANGQADAFVTGGRLAILDTREKVQFAAANVRACGPCMDSNNNVIPCNPWIGLYQDKTSGSFSEPAGGWVTLNGQPQPMGLFKTGQPDNWQGWGNVAEDCGMLLEADDGLNDGPCTYPSTLLVEWPLPTPTPTPTASFTPTRTATPSVVRQTPGTDAMALNSTLSVCSGPTACLLTEKLPITLGAIFGGVGGIALLCAMCFCFCPSVRKSANRFLAPCIGGSGGRSRYSMADLQYRSRLNPLDPAYMEAGYRGSDRGRKSVYHDPRDGAAKSSSDPRYARRMAEVDPDGMVPVGSGKGRLSLVDRMLGSMGMDTRRRDPSNHGQGGKQSYPPIAQKPAHATLSSLMHQSPVQQKGGDLETPSSAMKRSNTMANGRNGASSPDDMYGRQRDKPEVRFTTDRGRDYDPRKGDDRDRRPTLAPRDPSTYSGRSDRAHHRDDDGFRPQAGRGDPDARDKQRRADRGNEDVMDDDRHKRPARQYY